MSEKSISKMLFSNQEKVELGKIDDYKDIFQRISNLEDDAKADKNSLKAKLLKIKKEVDSANALEKQIEKQVSDLGLDLNNYITAGTYAFVKRVGKEADELYKRL